MTKKKKKDIPKFSQEIIETHCHLDYLKALELEETLEKAKEHSVSRIVTIAVDPDNLKSVRELSKKYPQIFGTQGIHPHEAKLYTDAVEKEIKDHVQEDKIVAVGEIGLDFHYNNSPKDIQIEVFERQLQIAVDLDMPVVIHSREAEKETIDILKKYSKSLKRKGVIHSFTSSLELAEFALNDDYCLGFNGIITFNSAQNVRDALSITPIERVLVETDAPFLTPVPYRGRENAPYYLPFIIEKIASEKEMSVDEVITQTTSNAKKLFHKLC